VLEGLTSAEVVEAVACREGMALAQDLSLHRTRVASDCVNAVRSIRGDGLGPYGPIVREIKARKSSFQHVEFVHESRSSNVDAHRLAKSSVYFALDRHVWFLSPPDGVCNPIMNQ
jgi:hypothetical protein